MIKPKICLSMIVKNEAHVIERCLKTVKPYVDSWVIADTGSTDDTKEIIHRFMSDLPGTLIERQWVDFASNRNQSLDIAHEYGDYALVIDADDTLEVDKDFRWPKDMADGGMMQIVDAGGTRYYRVAAPRLNHSWWWKGVLHEYLAGPPAAKTEKLSGIRILRLHNDGARSQQSLQEKFRKDAETLLKGIEKEPENERYVFYLAQSHRDAGDLTWALDAYEQRVKMGGWEEEVYFSKLQIAILKERLGNSFRDVAGAYLDAYAYRSSRAEPLCELARYTRLAEKYIAAREFAKIASLMPIPNDILFLDHSAYTWRARDEWAISAYWSGEFALSRKLCLDLLARPALPASDRVRIQKNLDFANAKLRKK